MNYYTADLHLSHENILKLCQRPFQTVEEMNNSIIDNINNTCEKGDTLYILGDVAGKSYVVKLLKKIECHKILIIGNHDNYQLHYNSFKRCFDDIMSSMNIVEQVGDEEYHIFLTHYPIVDWEGFYRGNWQFYGHVHNNKQGGSVIMNLFPNAVNVGVDVQEFKPKTAENLINERLTSYKKPEISMEQFMNTAVFVESDGRYKRSCDYSAYKT